MKGAETAAKRKDGRDRGNELASCFLQEKKAPAGKGLFGLTASEDREADQRDYRIYTSVKAENAGRRSSLEGKTRPTSAISIISLAWQGGKKRWPAGCRDRAQWKPTSARKGYQEHLRWDERRVKESMRRLMS